ncbi:hypothetical protein VM1G_07555 [Cytospora mali]|uniref:Zinc-binding loop region of homing endonuclease domain-containing protein n=1 Tax=Cytospora mali TaxID=578113 RepID=A0A194W8M6_CYTMA|nr:hypothetical protein VM1G_07555 [Valsa mali]
MVRCKTPLLVPPPKYMECQTDIRAPRVRTNWVNGRAQYTFIPPKIGATRILDWDDEDDIKPVITQSITPRIKHEHPHHPSRSLGQSQSEELHPRVKREASTSGSGGRGGNGGSSSLTDLDRHKYPRSMLQSHGGVNGASPGVSSTDSSSSLALDSETTSSSSSSDSETDESSSSSDDSDFGTYKPSIPPSRFSSTSPRTRQQSGAARVKPVPISASPEPMVAKEVKSPKHVPLDFYIDLPMRSQQSPSRNDKTSMSQASPEGASSAKSRSSKSPTVITGALRHDSNASYAVSYSGGLMSFNGSNAGGLGGNGNMIGLLKRDHPVLGNSPAEPNGLSSVAAAQHSSEGPSNPIPTTSESQKASQKRLKRKVLERPLSGHNPKLIFDDEDRPNVSEATVFLLRLSQQEVLDRFSRHIKDKDFFDLKHSHFKSIGCWVISGEASYDYKMKVWDKGEKHTFSFRRLAIRLWHDEHSMYSLLQGKNHQKAIQVCLNEHCMNPDHIEVESSKESAERHRFGKFQDMLERQTYPYTAIQQTDPRPYMRHEHTTKLECWIDLVRGDAHESGYKAVNLRNTKSREEGMTHLNIELGEVYLHHLAMISKGYREQLSWLEYGEKSRARNTCQNQEVIEYKGIRPTYIVGRRNGKVVVMVGSSRILKRLRIEADLVHGLGVGNTLDLATDQNHLPAESPQGDHPRLEA